MRKNDSPVFPNDKKCCRKQNDGFLKQKSPHGEGLRIILIILKGVNFVRISRLVR